MNHAYRLSLERRHAIDSQACKSFLISTIAWNAAHDWISFKFQFGRVEGGHLTLRYLAELMGSQIALASPFILVLGIFGLQRETFTSRLRGPLTFAALIVWPPLIYFLFHSLHERVQGNWPSFVYPALVLMAASTTNIAIGSGAPIARFSSRFALPAATLILLATYAQAAFNILPLGYADPKQHHFWDVAASAAISFGYSKIITTRFEKWGIYTSLNATPDGASVSATYRW